MKTLGTVFDGSTSLFHTQRVLYNSIGHVILLVQFKPVSHDHLLFVQALLQEFCSLGIRCALTGLHTPFIAGMHCRHMVVCFLR